MIHRMMMRDKACPWFKKQASKCSDREYAMLGQLLDWAAGSESSFVIEDVYTEHIHGLEWHFGGPSFVELYLELLESKGLLHRHLNRDKRTATWVLNPKRHCRCKEYA